MYTKSENQQSLQSKQMVTEALLTLMKQYSYQDITITQICQEAKVVRQTFYRNFEQKADIVDFYLESMLQTFVSEHIQMGEGEVYPALVRFYAFMYGYQDFLMLIEKNNLFHIMDRTITTKVPKFIHIPKVSERIKEPRLNIYVIGFISSTVCSILSLWVKNNFEDSIEMLAKLTTTFLSGLEMGDK